MTEPAPTPRARGALLLVALAVLSAGVDVAFGARGGRGWTAADVGLLWVLSAVGTAPFLLPALAAGWKWPARVSGLLVGSLILLHAAVDIRFGPMVNAPLLSPQVLGSWLALGAACAVGGWLLGPALGRLLTPKLLVGIAALGLLGLPVALVRIGKGAVERPAAAAGAPNVLVVTLDTTRRDFLSMYGRATDTPNLQGLADRGVVFEDAVAAAPQTGPSHLSILTGQYPLTHGVVANGTYIGEQPLISTALQRAGYQTGGFVAAFPVHERFAFDQGFDVYDSDFSPLVGLHELAWIKAFDAVVFRNLPRERTGDIVNARALRWLRRITDDERPFFAWVHYYDPHGPYTPPGEFDERYSQGPPKPGGAALPLPEYWPADQRAITDAAYLTAQYDAEIAWTDQLVGELLAAVESFDRETVIVVTADHGESLTEHGVYFDHGDDLYDVELRVPLLVVAPGAAAGSRVRCQTPTVDMVPTIYELTGVAPAEWPALDGRSRAADLRGGSCVDHDAYSSTVSERVMDPPVDHSLRRPDWKYILTEKGPDLLFDLIVDADEVDDRLEREPTTAAALQAVLSARLAGSAAPREAEMSPEVVQMLKDLGYVDEEEAE